MYVSGLGAPWGARGVQGRNKIICSEAPTGESTHPKLLKNRYVSIGFIFFVLFFECCMYTALTIVSMQIKRLTFFRPTRPGGMREALRIKHMIDLSIQNAIHLYMEFIHWGCGQIQHANPLLATLSLFH